MKELSKEKKQSSIEQRASRTAMMAAIHRFIASKEEQPNFQGPDNLAKLFLLAFIKNNSGRDSTVAVD